ncbi:hypothetical protein [Chryseobacterium indoltheticum]|uniref:hypothetical protein n=1 Tax=Chryseobacterium indoltheticum TaxID=254 RepID=UPI004043404B
MEENRFNQIIKSDSFALISDFVEISLDSLAKDDIIKDIPMIGTISKLLSIGNTINDRLFTKKLFHFLKELENINQDLILKEIQYIDDSKEYNQKVGEKLFEIITRIDSDEKPKIIGRLFRNFIDKKISYLVFLKLTNIVEKAFYHDLNLLCECDSEGKFYVNLDNDLYSLGLITHTGIGEFDFTDEEREEFNKITHLLSKKGKILLEYGLKS